MLNKYTCDVCRDKFQVGRMYTCEGKTHNFFVCNACYKKFKLVTRENMEMY